MASSEAIRSRSILFSKAMPILVQQDKGLTTSIDTFYCNASHSYGQLVCPVYTGQQRLRLACASAIWSETSLSTWNLIIKTAIYWSVVVRILIQFPQSIIFFLFFLFRSMLILMRTHDRFCFYYYHLFVSFCVVGRITVTMFSLICI